MSCRSPSITFDQIFFSAFVNFSRSAMNSIVSSSEEARVVQLFVSTKPRNDFNYMGFTPLIYFSKLGVGFSSRLAFFQRLLQKVFESHGTYWVQLIFYQRSSWDYLRALLNPKFLLSSASLSETSLIRICGEKCHNYYCNN